MYFVAPLSLDGLPKRSKFPGKIVRDSIRMSFIISVMRNVLPRLKLRHLVPLIDDVRLAEAFFVLLEREQLRERVLSFPTSTSGLLEPDDLPVIWVSDDAAAQSDTAEHVTDKQEWGRKRN